MNQSILARTLQDLLPDLTSDLNTRISEMTWMLSGLLSVSISLSHLEMDGNFQPDLIFPLRGTIFLLKKTPIWRKNIISV